MIGKLANFFCLTLACVTVQAGILFPDCEKYLNKLVVPRPTWSTKPTHQSEDLYILAFPKIYQPTIEHAVRNLLTHVSQAEFEAALYRSIDKLINELPDGSVVSVFDWRGDGQKSNEWVTQLALKYIFDNKRDADKVIELKIAQDKKDLRNSDLNLFFDDALFSGHQMTYEVIEPNKPKDMPYFVIAPFHTDDSRLHLDHSRLITDTEMPTYGADKQFKYWFAVFEKDDFGSTLIVFDHLEPDSASSLKLNDPRVEDQEGSSKLLLIKGDVVGSDGIRQVDFIPEPDKPYQRRH